MSSRIDTKESSSPLHSTFYSQAPSPLDYDCVEIGQNERNELETRPSSREATRFEFVQLAFVNGISSVGLWAPKQV